MAENNRVLKAYFFELLCLMERFDVVYAVSTSERANQLITSGVETILPEWKWDAYYKHWFIQMNIQCKLAIYSINVNYDKYRIVGTVYASGNQRFSLGVDENNTEKFVKMRANAFQIYLTCEAPKDYDMPYCVQVNIQTYENN